MHTANIPNVYTRSEEKRKSAHTKILTQKPTKSKIAKTQQRRHSDKSDEKTKLLSSSTWSEQIKYINTVLIIIYCISNTLIRFDRMVVAVWDGVKSIKPSNTTKKIVLVSLAMQHIQHITKTSICALCVCVCMVKCVSCDIHWHCVCMYLVVVIWANVICSYVFPDVW